MFPFFRVETERRLDRGHEHAIHSMTWLIDQNPRLFYFPFDDVKTPKIGTCVCMYWLQPESITQSDYNTTLSTTYIQVVGNLLTREYSMDHPTYLFSIISIYFFNIN